MLNHFIYLFIYGLMLASNLQTTALAHEYTYHHARMPAAHHTQTNTVAVHLEKIIDQNTGKTILFKLQYIASKKPITLADLNEVHTEKMHALIIDDGLEDYSHLHPKATDKPGIYELNWQPKRPGNYTMWVDIVPKATDQQEFVSTIIPLGEYQPVIINRTPFNISKVNGFTFTLTFDQKQLTANKTILGTISITDSTGKPVNNLQPVMGAYAHIVGFSDDLKTVIHTHPMGGTSLQFHLQTEKAGFIKLFAQVKINNKELFVPFGLLIEPAV